MLLLLVPRAACAQQTEYLFSPDPAIGDTLDSAERLRYRLFPRFDGFQWAIFSLNEDNSLNAYVWTETDGNAKMVTIRRYGMLSDLQDQIALYDDEEDERSNEPARYGIAVETGTYLVAFPFMLYGGPTCEIPISHSFMARVTVMAGGIFPGEKLILEDNPVGSGLLQVDVRFKRTRRSRWYGFGGLAWIKPFRDEIVTAHHDVLQTQHWWDIFHLTAGTGYLFDRVQLELTARVAWYPNLWNATRQRRLDYATLSASVRYIIQ